MGEVNVSPDEEERIHFRRIIAAFRCYRDMYDTKLRRAETNLRKLSARHQQLLRSYRLHLRAVRECIEKNSEVLLAIVRDAYALFENAEEYEPFSSRPCGAGFMNWSTLVNSTQLPLQLVCPLLS